MEDETEIERGIVKLARTSGTGSERVIAVALKTVWAIVVATIARVIAILITEEL